MAQILGTNETFGGYLYGGQITINGDGSGLWTSADETKTATWDASGKGAYQGGNGEEGAFSIACEDGRVSNIVWTDTTYDYNEDGLLSGKTIESAAWNYTTTYDYNEAGQVSTETYMKVLSPRDEKWEGQHKWDLIQYGEVNESTTKTYDYNEDGQVITETRTDFKYDRYNDRYNDKVITTHSDTAGYWTTTTSTCDYDVEGQLIGLNVTTVYPPYNEWGWDPYGRVNTKIWSHDPAVATTKTIGEMLEHVEFGGWVSKLGDGWDLEQQSGQHHQTSWSRTYGDVLSLVFPSSKTMVTETNATNMADGSSTTTTYAFEDLPDGFHEGLTGPAVEAWKNVPQRQASSTTTKTDSSGEIVSSETTTYLWEEDHYTGWELTDTDSGRLLSSYDSGPPPLRYDDELQLQRGWRAKR